MPQRVCSLLNSGRPIGVLMLWAVIILAACGGSHAAAPVSPVSTASHTAVAAAAAVTVTPARSTQTPTPTPISTEALCKIYGGCSTPTPAASTTQPTSVSTPQPTSVSTTQPPTVFGTFTPLRLPTRRPSSPTPPPAPTVQPSASVVVTGPLSPAQLRQALLTEPDLGRRWELNDTATVPRVQYPAVYADFNDDVDLVGSLSIELHDARNGAPDYLATRLLAGKSLVTLNEVPRLQYGTTGAHYHFSLDDDGERLYGDLAAWRQGAVVVVMLVEGSDASVCLCDLARQQDGKLRATVR